MRSLLLTSVVMTVPGVVFAADTVETFEEGLSDLEAGFMADGLHLSSASPAVTSSVLLGYGFTPSFSAYYGVNAGGMAGSPSMTHHLGLFGTPYQGSRLAFDLGFEAALASGGVVALSWTEVNLDARSSSFNGGIFLRLEGFGAYEEGSLGLSGVGTLGARWSPADAHEFLLEYHHPLEAVASTPKEGPWPAVFHLGYNVLLNAHLELVSELQLSSTGEGLEAWRPSGISVGFIATLPTAG